MEQDPRLDVLRTRPISAWSYPRVLVGIPLERSISYADKTFWPFMHIAMQQPAFAPTKYGRIDFVRNQLAIKLIQSTYTHVLMLDVDHAHPPDIIERLARWVVLDPAIQVVGGLNFRRGAPFDPVCRVYAKNDHQQSLTLADWEPGLVEVDEIGGGSLLVSRTVFEQLEPPWFFNIYDEIWENSWPGEDIGFSRKCREAGIEMFVDTTTSSPHCTEGMITEETYRRYMKSHPEEISDEQQL